MKLLIGSKVTDLSSCLTLVMLYHFPQLFKHVLCVSPLPCPLALNAQPHQSPPPLCSDKVASLSLSHSICPSFAYEPIATTKSSDSQPWLLIRITWATFKSTNSQDSSPEILIKLNLSPLFSTYQYRVLYKIFNYVKYSCM